MANIRNDMAMRAAFEDIYERAWDGADVNIRTAFAAGFAGGRHAQRQNDARRIREQSRYSSSDKAHFYFSPQGREEIAKVIEQQNGEIEWTST